jgi:hypothetical protein
MADSINPLQQVIAGTGAAVQVNDNFAATSPAMLFGRNATTTSGLTWGFYGGRLASALIANGTVALTASSTNHVVALRSSGVVSSAVATTNWNDPLYLRLYRVIAGATTVTSYEDHRQAYAAAVATPQNSQSAAYTLVLDDAGKQLLHPSADTTARTWTIPANAAVAFPIGTVVTFVNQNAAGVITIAITTNTMRLAGPGTTGSRTLAANGIATAIKITATEWIISGTGLT